MGRAGRFTECPPNLSAFVLPGNQMGDEPELNVEPKSDLGKRHYERAGRFTDHNVLRRSNAAAENRVPESTQAASHKVLESDCATFAGKQSYDPRRVQSKRTVNIEVKETFSSRGKKAFKVAETKDLLGVAVTEPSRAKSAHSMVSTSAIPSAGVPVTSTRCKKVFVSEPVENILEQPYTPKCVVPVKSTDASAARPAGPRIVTTQSIRTYGWPEEGVSVPVVRCKKTAEFSTRNQHTVKDTLANTMPNNPQNVSLEVTVIRDKRDVGKRHFY